MTTETPPPDTERRISRLEGAFEQQNERLGDIHAELRDFRQETSARFATMDAKFATMDTKIDGLRNIIDNLRNIIIVGIVGLLGSVLAAIVTFVLTN